MKNYLLYMFFLLTANCLGQQGMELEVDDSFEKTIKENYVIYCDSTENQMIILQLNNDEHIHRIAFYTNSNVDSTYEKFSNNIFGNAAYFEFDKKDRISAFINFPTQEYTTIVFSSKKNDSYVFYEEKNQIFGLSVETRKKRLKKIFIGNTD